MASIKLDICQGDVALHDVLHDLTAGLDVTFDATGVVAGGGWPEYEFTGPATHLIVVAVRYAGEGASPADRHLDPHYVNLRETLADMEKQLGL